ncbi:MAG: helix-turn-helix domain-containing protein, partial [Tardiphaga sp.]
MRIANERAVMTLIGLNPGASNAELARLSGLGPQTTSRIVADLEARELVLRGEVLRGRRGQPATPLFLNPDGAYGIGIEIGWRHFDVLLFAMSGATLASVRRRHDWPDFRTIFAAVATEVS